MIGYKDSHELWRENAAKSYSDDRYTPLFHELMEAWSAFRKVDMPFEFGVYIGLRQAYGLLTGDSEEAVNDQVARAVRDQVA